MIKPRQTGTRPTSAHGRTLSPHPRTRLPPAEQAATTNRAAFLHWLRAVHAIALNGGESALPAWAEADPAIAAAIILDFAGPGFESARLAAGLLLAADLRPDDLILLRGEEPDWLPQALQATRGLGGSEQATVLVTDHPPESLPPKLRRMILIGDLDATAPPGITVSHARDWTYPRESSAD